MTEKKTFKDFGLSAKVLEAINKKGFEEPTPIQVMAIPMMLRDDTNIIVQAQTGTGKTAAFGLPLVEMVNTDSAAVQALILAPTRELAIQVAEEINSLKGNRDIIITPIYGGQSIDMQLQRLKKGVHIVVGTPGRVIDHLNRKTLKLEKIEHLILDEADEMLNMGFVEDIEEIMKHTNPDKRTLLFSATMPERIKALAHKYMKGYEFIKVKKEQLTTNLTEQIYFEVKATDKFEALCRIIDIKDAFYGLVFCRTKIDVDSVATHLMDRGYDAEAIHGDISQTQRERTLEKFKKKRVTILVATDVAARGIDVNNLTHVINYSLPEDTESYVHRIGRTGRAGNLGTAITFITPSEYKRLMFIQRVAKTDIKKSKVPKVKDIIKAKKKKIYEDLTTILKEKIDADYLSWADRMLKDNNPEEILAAVLNYCFEEELNPDVYGEIEEIGSKPKPLDKHGKARLFVALGKKDKINAEKLVELIGSKASVKSKDISEIQIMDKFSFITVPFEKAEKIVVSFREKGRKPLISHANKNGQSAFKVRGSNKTKSHSKR
ncbi:MAG: DEAD/DEAH box helicase [Proteobacteria bacterium]|nr:DEAD/DEAH box helicase [Pseudomonadota bacterium]